MIDSVTYLDEAPAPERVRPGLLCLRWTPPYTALTGRPVGKLRGGPARAFDVDSTLSCFGDRFIYLIYGYGSRGAVAGGPRTRWGGSENPGPIGWDQGGKGVNVVLTARLLVFVKR